MFSVIGLISLFLQLTLSYGDNHLRMLRGHYLLSAPLSYPAFSRGLLFALDDHTRKLFMASSKFMVYWVRNASEQYDSAKMWYDNLKINFYSF